ncbi:MAG: class I SAM-dependent methyltransferase [Thermoleophilaceae bacterium]|nr:class I SAM-dependent methyltransferase [Thermoleophilaceae bacterium]
MRSKFLETTPELYEYVIATGARQDDALARVERETAALGDVAVMQVAPDQGALITLLTRIQGAHRALEIGTFTGYSAICLARGLADGGRLVCCELSDEYAAIARDNLDSAGVGDLVDIRVGPALDTLAAMDPDERFDVAFIDADKTSYPAYYERVLERLDPGGLLLLDNVLLAGRVLDPADGDDAANAVAGLNRAIEADQRVDLVMIPIADGLTIVRKRR